MTSTPFYCGWVLPSTKALLYSLFGLAYILCHYGGCQSIGNGWRERYRVTGTIRQVRWIRQARWIRLPSGSGLSAYIRGLLHFSVLRVLPAWDIQYKERISLGCLALLSTFAFIRYPSFSFFLGSPSFSGWASEWLFFHVFCLQYPCRKRI